MKINFKELFDEKILKRGYNYYLEDSVREVNKNGSCYEGLIYETEIYEVQIEINNNGNVEDMNCDCPYAEENNCKHMAALLYYLENDRQVENKKNIRYTDNYDKIIDRISEDEIKEFILERLYENYDFQNEFRSYFVQYFEKTPKRVYERRISKDSGRKISIYRKEKLRRCKKDITTYENIERWSKTCRKDSRRI